MICIRQIIIGLVSVSGLWLIADATYATYPITNDPTFIQEAYLKASNVDDEDEFGASVSLDENTLVIGAPLEDSNAVGVDGDQSNNLASDSGAVYVFVREDGNWIQQAYLKASNTDEGDRFGSAVAIDDDTLVVGARFEDGGSTGVNGDQNTNSKFNSGAAYVFIRTGSTWSQQAYLKASNSDGGSSFPTTTNGDLFGVAVAVSGDTIVIGARNEDSLAAGVNGNQFSNSARDAGAAYVFVRDNDVWTQQAYLKASNPGGAVGTPPFTFSGDLFGEVVAISEDTIVIGAWAEDSNATGVNGNQFNNSAFNSGAAYVFFRQGSAWSQQAYLKASNADGGTSSGVIRFSGDLFGSSVAVSGDTIVVGASNEDSSATGVNGNQLDNSASGSGAVYTFERNGSTWNQQAYLKASNTGGVDGFGTALAISVDRLVVGADGEDSNAVGVNGDQSNNLALDSGAVYLFERIGSTWQQLIYLKSSNTDPNDGFGDSVAISGDLVLVGAPMEDSDTEGVNGNQPDNTSTDSGAAYVSGFFKTFAIGGTVSGLTGSSLTLQNNGGDDLMILADGVFTFDAPIIDGQPYNVTVAVQPTSPDQICIVINGSSTVNGTAVTDIQVNCQLPSDIRVLPSILDFGDQPLGVATAVQMAVVESTGEGDLLIDSVMLSGPQSSDFQITTDLCTGATLPTDAACGLDVVFTASAPGIHNAWVEILSNAPESPSRVELVGSSGVLFFDGFEQD